jgi:hypothetical protein
LTNRKEYIKHKSSGRLSSLCVAEEPRCSLWLLAFLGCGRVLCTGKDDWSVPCDAICVCISSTTTEWFGDPRTAEEVGGLGYVSGADLGSFEALFDGSKLGFESAKHN